MLVRDLLTKLNDSFPFDSQSDWDNTGLQIGNPDSVIGGIYVSLDAEIFNIKKAIEMNSNVIITHHPLFYDGVKSLTKGNFFYDVLELVIKHDISIISVHTPFDFSNDGMKKFFLTEIAKSEVKTFVEDDDLGIIFDIDKRPLRDIKLILKSHYEELLGKEKTEYIRIYGELGASIKRIAYVGGSGASFIKNAINSKVDLYITSDIKYHEAQNAIRNELCLVDLTHSVSEIQFVSIISEIIKDLGITKVYGDLDTFDGLMLKNR
ncbi:MAG: Nif3-like dinuclear metal center hexameric protein [Ezakiella sp.]|nr:Nif3-like dinuclear metal center hexameric protein [Ezakiella sp.]MDD7471985.1 Nif3-like dinuclear metal center hexameric protein [Bacillota bacterium]MDY3923949.1 Nif3-like dinuclear metal center hexameric protein [Ezakiella sp.]